MISRMEMERDQCFIAESDVLVVLRLHVSKAASGLADA